MKICIYHQSHLSPVNFFIEVYYNNFFFATTQCVVNNNYTLFWNRVVLKINDKKMIFGSVKWLKIGWKIKNISSIFTYS